MRERTSVTAFLRRIDIATVILVAAFILGAIYRIDVWPNRAGSGILRSLDDSTMYNAIASNLVGGKGYVGTDFMLARSNRPTAFYGPTYPFYMALIYAVSGKSIKAVQLSQQVLSFAIAFLIFLLGKKVYGRVEGALAAFVFVASPQIIIYSFKEISETLFIFLEVALFILAISILRKERPSMRAFAGSGVLFGIAYLCRQTIVLFPAILLVFMWLKYRENGYAWLLKAVAIFTAGSLLVIAPWAIRNYLAFGELMAGTTTGPATLWWGTYEDKGLVLNDLAKQYRDEHPNMNEVQMANQMTKEAKRRLLRTTKDYLIYKLEWRFGRLFSIPDPLNLKNSQMRVGIIYLTLTILGIAGLFITSAKQYERLIMGIYVVAVLGLHIATHTVLRYLMPEVPFLTLGVIYLLSSLASGIKQKDINCISLSILG